MSSLYGAKAVNHSTCIQSIMHKALERTRTITPVNDDIARQILKMEVSTEIRNICRKLNCTIEQIRFVMDNRMAIMQRLGIKQRGYNIVSNKPRKYSDEQLTNMIKLSLEVGPVEASKRLGIPKGTVTHYLSDYKRGKLFSGVAL